MFSIGLDIGTTTVCGLLIDAQTGRTERVVTLPNDSSLPGQHSWERLQDPSRLLSLVRALLDELLSANLPVACIGLTGQMHGILYLDEDGAPLTSLITWQDGRGDQMHSGSQSFAQHMQEVTGYPCATGYGLVTCFYDMTRGLLPRHAVSICTIHDWIAMCLTGNTRPLVHASDAASLGLFSLKDGCFDRTAIASLGLSHALLPKVCAGFTLAGEYRGIPVAAAIGDNQASFLGSVADIENSLLVNIGTGGQISCFSETLPGGDIDCRPLVGSGCLLVGSSLCAGRAYAMLEAFFREVAQTVTGISVESAYPAMDRLLSQYGGEYAPLDVSTCFSGTRTFPQKRGEIRNIGTDNLHMAALCDGFLRGMAEEIHGMYRDMCFCLREEKRFLVGSGNGIRRNALLRQKFEQLFGLPMLLPAHKEEAAFGASLYALVASGHLRNMEEAGRLICYIE